MLAKDAVLLVTREPGTANAVAKALERSERLETNGAYAALDDLAGRLERESAPLALVDIDPRPREMLKALEELSARFAGTRFVVLAREMRGEMLLEAMQAGARHFLIKEEIDAQLHAVLQRLLPNGVETRRAANLITVLSASGGAGATTIAVNLANEIQLAAGSPVLLVDFDPAYGAAASALDLEAQFGVGDVLSSPERIDADLIRSTAVPYSDHLSVLAGAAARGLGSRSVPDYTQLERTVAACTSAYSVTVIDAARVPIEVAAALGRASRSTLAVFQFTVRDVRAVKMLSEALEERGVERRRFLAIGNRREKHRDMVTLDDARRALGDLAVETVANDFRSAIRALNYGEPLSRAAPRSPLRRDLARLAAKLSHRSAPAGPVAAGRSAT
jgi:pilus assembly protein CpaE